MSDATQTEFSMPTPGPEHDLLKPFAGKFRATVKLWMGPGDPMESTGTMINSWQLGGLYLHQDYQGDQVEGPFPSFMGKGFWGYNAASGNYEGFWIDNASTTMQTEEGRVDASGKSWEMIGEVQHPQSGQLIKKRTIITLIDDNQHTHESFHTGPDGTEMKTMHIDYVRQ